MSDGWSEGWPITRTFVVAPLANHGPCIAVEVVPLSEAVPKSELQPILDGLNDLAGNVDQADAAGERDPYGIESALKARDALAALLSTDSEEG